jgi:hypothetical protein
MDNRSRWYSYKVGKAYKKIIFYNNKIPAETAGIFVLSILNKIGRPAKPLLYLTCIQKQQCWNFLYPNLH